MNKRIKKKYDESIWLGYDKMLSYSHIKYVKKIYHLYELLVSRIYKNENNLIDKFNEIGCTSFYMTPDELKKLGVE